MSEEIFLEGKNYVSSKKAAGISGYAQDYIGQLARGGLIDAQRVGGLWYVSMDSLGEYQRNAAAYTPLQPAKAPQDLDAVVSFDGKEYVSASRGAKMTGYNQDYIGQLARGGKLLSRQIGNRWYVERESLLSHKSEKDRMLAAVQAESVGLVRPAPARVSVPEEPLLTYFSEQKDLIPALKSRPMEMGPAAPALPTISARQPIPIRVVQSSVSSRPSVNEGTRAERSAPRSARKTIYRAAEAGVALTFVLVLSYGLFSLKDSSVYAVVTGHGSPAVTSSALAANATGAVERFTAILENWIVPQLTYTRH